MYALNQAFIGKKAGNGLLIRSQNMGPNGEIFRAMRAVRDRVWGLFGSFVS